MCVFHNLNSLSLMVFSIDLKLNLHIHHIIISKSQTTIIEFNNVQSSHGQT